MNQILDPCANVLVCYGEPELSLEHLCAEQYRLDLYNVAILSHVADKELRAKLPDNLKHTTNNQLRVWLMRNHIQHDAVRRIVTPRYHFDLYQPPPEKHNKEAPRRTVAVPFGTTPCFYMHGSTTDSTPDKRLLEALRDGIIDGLAAEIQSNVQAMPGYNTYTALELNIEVDAFLLSIFGYVHLLKLPETT